MKHFILPSLVFAMVVAASFAVKFDYWLPNFDLHFVRQGEEFRCVPHPKLPHYQPCHYPTSRISKNAKNPWSCCYCNTKIEGNDRFHLCDQHRQEAKDNQKNTFVRHPNDV